MSNQVRDLEKRIEALEQEVQLLNVQIKYTLLEIQEHLLNGAYPALQSNDMPSVETAEQTQSVATPASPQKKAALHSQISRIRLDDVGQVAEMDAPAVNPSVQQTPASSKTDVSLHTLEAWMLKKVQHIGSARTRRLIEIYAQNGQLSASSTHALQQLLKVYDEPRNEKAGSRRSAPAYEIPPLPAAIRRTVEHEPAAPKSTRNKTVATTASSRRDTAPRPGASKTQAVGSSSMPAPAQIQTADRPSNMVLRLIAGVQSAGIGITRRKLHG